VETILTGSVSKHLIAILSHSSFALSQKKGTGKHKMSKNIIECGVHMSPISNIKNHFDVAQPKLK
jgi:hypothetical protein